MALSEEQRKLAESYVMPIGLFLANYKRFGDEALKVASDYFYNFGKSAGQSAKQKLGITRSDAPALGALLNTLMPSFGTEATVKVEGNKVIIDAHGFCPVMEAVKIMKAPWETVCRNCSWPVMEGTEHAVNPNAKREMLEHRAWGNKRCLEVVTVPK
jgi:hypothetical protein